MGKCKDSGNCSVGAETKSVIFLLMEEILYYTIAQIFASSKCDDNVTDI